MAEGTGLTTDPDMVGGVVPDKRRLGQRGKTMYALSAVVGVASSWVRDGPIVALSIVAAGLGLGLVVRQRAKHRVILWLPSQILWLPLGSSGLPAETRTPL